MAFVNSGLLRFGNASGTTRSINIQMGYNYNQTNSSLDLRHDYLFDWATKPNWTSGNPSKVSEFYGANEGGGGGECIAYDTRITNTRGEGIKIQDLRVGDVLLSYKIEDLDETAENASLEAFNYSSAKVKPLLKTSTTIVSLTQSDSAKDTVIINGTLHITTYDSVLTFKKDGDPLGFRTGKNIWIWIEASRVEVGDYIIGKNFQEMKVTEVEYNLGKNQAPTYQMDCEPYDWYYAGGILVHNKK